jgi:hypothetical protein
VLGSSVPAPIGFGTVAMGRGCART